MKKKSTSHEGAVPPVTVDALRLIWEKAASLGHADLEQGFREITAAISALFGAANTSWLAITHGYTPTDDFSKQVFEGWWVRDHADFSSPPKDFKKIELAFLRLAKEHGIGADTQHVIDESGCSRVTLRQDAIPDADWENHWKRKHFYLPHLNIDERMHVVYAINPQAESYFLIDRAPGTPPFTEQDRQVALLLTCGLAPLHRRLFLARGLMPPSTKAFSPREREIFPLLFSPLTEKEIAEQLGISPHTVHQYIRSIYKSYGVGSRAALMAHCL